MPTNDWSNPLVRASGEDSRPEEWLPKEPKRKATKPAQQLHPGAFIREEMEARGWSKESLQKLICLASLAAVRAGKGEVEE